MVLPVKAPGIDIPEMDDLEEAETMLADTVREWTQEWKNEGLEEGWQSQVRLVARQLELKFGSLDDNARARVEAGSTEQLFVWGERILTAADLDEVF